MSDTDQVPNPSDGVWSWLRWRLIEAIGDTAADADRYPDYIAAPATVTLTPVIGDFTSYGPPATVVPRPITFKIGTKADVPDPADPSEYVGWMLDGNGKKDVAVIAGQYTVRVNSPDFTMRVFTVDALPSYTEDAPGDLALLRPIAPPPPAVVVVSDQTRIAAEAAQAGAEEAQAAAQAAAAAAEAPTDEMVAGLIPDSSGSATAAALVTTIAAGRIPPQSPVNAFARLDKRDPSFGCIALASDSTMDQSNEGAWIALSQRFPTVWPERKLVGKIWSLTDGAYQADVILNTGVFPGNAGVPAPNTVLLHDSFARNGELYGSAPDVSITGGVWGGSGTGNYVAAAGVVQETAASAGSQYAFSPAWQNLEQAVHLSTTVTRATGPATPQTIDLGVGVDISNYIRLSITGQNAVTANLVKYIGATATTIGTFTPVPWTTASPVTASVSLDIATDGTVTATLNGVTVTAALSSGELNAVLPLSGSSEMLLRTGKNIYTVFALGPVTVTGLANIGAQPEIDPGLPQISYYNGGAAGQTLDSYQMLRMDDMYPVRPDLLIINMGHNYADTITHEQLAASFSGFVTALEVQHGGQPIPVAITSQNPRFGTPEDDLHRDRMVFMKSYAQSQGWGYIPTYEAFSARPDGGRSYIQVESSGAQIHPAIGTGRVLEGTVIGEWLETESGRPLADDHPGGDTPEDILDGGSL